MICFTVPSKTYNKVLINHYYIARLPSFPIKMTPRLVACIVTSKDDFKESSHLFAPLNPINMTTLSRRHPYFPSITMPTKRTSGSPHLLPQVELTPPPLPQHINKDVLKCTFSTSLTCN